MLGRSLAATLFAIVAWSGAARAEGPPYPYPATPYAPPPHTEKEKKPLLYRVFHPLDQHGCWQHYDSDYNFGTFRSEAHFIFDSSRTFFNEPCYKGGPPGQAPCTDGSCWKNS